VLVRHGVTQWNEEGRVQGHVQTPLSDAGRGQAQRVAARLAGVSFAAAYTSDLTRALETAQLLLDSRPVPLRPVLELRELSYGHWEGRVFREIQRDEPDRYEALMKRPTEFVPPGGEGIADLLRRVAEFASRLREAHGPEETLLIVGHLGSLRALLLGLLDLPAEAIWRFALRPASVSVLSVYPDTATLEEWNSVSHLEGT
jgi:broad specificity phosphatase PhoE